MCHPVWGDMNFSLTFCPNSFSSLYYKCFRSRFSLLPNSILRISYTVDTAYGWYIVFHLKWSFSDTVIRISGQLYHIRCWLAGWLYVRACIWPAALPICSGIRKERQRRQLNSTKIRPGQSYAYTIQFLFRILLALFVIAQNRPSFISQARMYVLSWSYGAM